MYALFIYSFAFFYLSQATVQCTGRRDNRVHCQVLEVSLITIIMEASSLLTVSSTRDKKLSYRRDSARCGCRSPQSKSI